MLKLSHWGNIAQYDGKRIPLLDNAGVPYGWVVNGRLANEFQNKIRTIAIPLKIGGVRLLACYKAKQFKKRIEHKYGGEVIMLMVPHEDTECGWFARFVLLSDFVKTADTIRSEMTKALNDHDPALCDSKECLWLALTGRTDPE